jgi:hypothetical protein
MKASFDGVVCGQTHVDSAGRLGIEVGGAWSDNAVNLKSPTVKWCQFNPDYISVFHMPPHVRYN